MLLVAFAGLASRAYAWDNFQTHPSLGDAAVARANSSGVLDRFLRQAYGFDDGISEILACRVGFDRFAEPDEEINEGGRFHTTLGLGGAPADRVRLYSGSGFDLPHALRAGAFGEDNPNQRARHHFHDPELVHPPPAGNRGLDANVTWLGFLDQLAFELGACFKGGDFERCKTSVTTLLTNPLFYSEKSGNFSGRGRSARDRALNLPLGEDFPSGEDPRNLFALPDAERYAYWAIAGISKEEREHAMILQLLAVGSVLHLLQDQTSPGHVRNDFNSEHLKGYIWGDGIEQMGTQKVPLDLILQLASESSLYASRPRAFLDHAFPMYASPTFDPTQFAPQLPNVDTTSIKLREFFDSGPTGGGGGLAEITNRNFLSRGTVSNDEYASPALPEGDCLAGTLLPVRRIDDPLDPQSITEAPELDLFVTSPLVPHLAHCRFSSQLIASYGSVQEVTTLELSVIEESVQRDYMEILFPLAVDFSEKFLARYFSQRIEVVASGDSFFRFKNLTPLPIRAQADAIEVVYEDANGSRRVAPVGGCTADVVEILPADEPGQEPPLSEAECMLPGSLTAEPEDPTSFWIVVRGTHGELGQLASAEEYDGSNPKDYVVAFDRVLPRLVYEVNVHAPGGSDQDQQFQHRLFAVEADKEMLAEPGRSPTVVDLSEEILRDFQAAHGLSEDGVAHLDIGVASAEPHGHRIAFMADLDEVLSEETPALLSDVWVFDPTATTSAERLRRIPAPPGQRPAKGEFDIGKALDWNGDASRDVVSFVTREPSANYPIWVASNQLETSGAVGPTTQVELPIHSWILESAHGTKLAGTVSPFCTPGSPDCGAAIWLLDGASGAPTHYFDVPAGLVRSCDEETVPCGGLGRISVDAAFSSDGRRVAFVSAPYATPWSAGGLYVADLDQGTITAVPGVPPIVRGPVWSPDDRFIAYWVNNDTADVYGDLFVVEAAGGVPVRITAGEAGQRDKSSLTWSAPLQLRE